MSQHFISTIAAILFIMGGAQAQAQSLNLKSDSKTVNSKARSIESSYVQDLKENSANTQSLMNTPATYAQPGDYSDLEPAQSPAPALENSSSSYHPENTNTFAYDSTLKMREELKVGAGIAVGGAIGAAGFNLELNFEDADGVLAGFGTGPGYNSVQVAWKHAFEGRYLAPYTTVGYSRWYNSRGRSDAYSSSSILDRVLTDNEKRDGRFGTDFLNVSLGLQYNQLSGDFAGMSFFGELTSMYEMKRASLLPNGSIGAIYYF